jgi:hypothetical protein
MSAQSYTLDPRTDLRTIEDVYLVQEDVAVICRVTRANSGPSNR